MMMMMMTMTMLMTIKTTKICVAMMQLLFWQNGVIFWSILIIFFFEGKWPGETACPISSQAHKPLFGAMSIISGAGGFLNHLNSKTEEKNSFFGD